LLYLSVLAFTTGMGYNLSSWFYGHSTILSLILVVTVVCYYFSFKTVLDFKKQTQFENPVFDYLILAASFWLVFFDICNSNILLLHTLWISNPNPYRNRILLCLLFWQQSILSIAITGRRLTSVYRLIPNRYWVLISTTKIH
jgi:hypothetical protein